MMWTLIGLCFFLVCPHILCMISNSPLYVVGAGRLGTRILELWTKENPHHTAIGETKHRKDQKDSICIDRVSFTDRDSRDEKKTFDNVIICFPPQLMYYSKDVAKLREEGLKYLQEVNDAMKLWNRRGTLVFVSTTGVMQKQPDNEEYQSILKKAEDIALERGAHVVRLGGLYDIDSGPHRVWLQQWRHAKEMSDAKPIRPLNMIHYDDAATLCCKVIAGGPSLKKRVLVGASVDPISNQEYCEVALQHVLSSEEYPMVKEWIARSFSFQPYKSSHKIIGERAKDTLDEIQSIKEFGRYPMHTTPKDIFEVRSV